MSLLRQQLRVVFALASFRSPFCLSLAGAEFSRSTRAVFREEADLAS